MTIYFENLPNGVDVVIKESHFSKMVAVQAWLDVGSLHETPQERGMAHLIEHMLFKGTAKRQVGEISTAVEALGGDINAYTTFDHTVYYINLPQLYVKEGLDLLLDAIFSSSFDPEELEKEKEVVIEEIKRGMDNPGSVVGRKIFSLMYAGTEAARPIIGDVESVSGFTREQVWQFYKKWYHPKNLKLIVVGDVDTPDLMKTIKEILPVSGETNLASGMTMGEISKVKRRDVHLIKGEYEQPRIEIAFHGPNMEDYDSAMMDLTAFALGAGDAARLNRIVRDQLGVVSSVGATIYAPKFGGIFEASAFTSEDLFLAAVQNLAKELYAIRTFAPITSEELARARAALEVEKVSREETVVGQARQLGQGLRTKYGIHNDIVYEALINNATEKDVQKAIAKWFSSDEVAIVGLLPKESKITEKDVLQAFEAGLAELAKQGAQAGPLSPRREPKKLPEIFDIGPGLKLVHRHNPDNRLFNIVAVTEGGQRSETTETSGLFNAIGNLLGYETLTKSLDEITDLVEGRGADLYGFSGKDSLGLKLQCLSDHSEELLEIWADCLLRPVFNEQKWSVLQREIEQMLRSEADSASGTALKVYRETLFGSHPYGMPIHGGKNSIENMTCEKLATAYQAFLHNGPWILSCVSDLEGEKVAAILKKLFTGFKPKTKRQMTTGKLQYGMGEVFIAKNKEQAHFIMGYPGLTWGDPDRPVIDVISAILGGSGGRLFIRLRDQESLAYSVTPIQSYGCDGGTFGAYIACSPEKVERAIASLEREYNVLIHEKINDDELNRAINYIVGGHEDDCQRGEAQAMTMGLMEAYGIGYDDFLTYSARIKKVKAEDILRVAGRILDPSRQTRILVGPEGVREKVYGSKASG
jgi:zinc protease